jgi:Transposase DDE domain
MDEAVWNHAVFSKNRERLLNEEIAEAFFQRVLKIAEPYLSDEHFTVDGTLIEAWASHKSFRPKDQEPGASGGGEANFHGETRRNDTHQSTTDPEAKLFKKSKGSEAKLSYLGHVLMENRNGLLVQTVVTPMTGTAERHAALLLAQKIPGIRRITLGADKAYDAHGLVRELRRMHITPHVAQNNTSRLSAIDGRTTNQAGYGLRPQPTKAQKGGTELRLDEDDRPARKVRFRGREKVGWWMKWAGAAYNLIRLRNLQAEAMV